MEKSSFFDSDVINGQYDRVYSAEDFASYFNTVLTTGIFPSPSTNLQVVANNNMTVTVKSGDAFINGYMYHNTDDLTLELNTADGVLKRIDLVVVRLDHVKREIKCHIKTGTFGSSPVKPSLTRNEDVYELCLAEINIGNGIISIHQDSIIDTRYNSSVCGIVNSLIEIDTEEIYSQMRGLIEQREEEFFKWFNDLKVNLDGNVATNLQGQINVLEDDVLINNTSEDLLNENVTSFKVGTGTVEGIRKDYTEQMKQSIITLDNIVGKTVKEGTILKDITINIDDVNYCTLRSLPNGVCDEIKNNTLINNVGVYNVPYDADWVYDGNVQSSGVYTTAVWYLKLPNISKINDNVNSCYAICNDSKLSETTSWSVLKNRYDVGVALTSGDVVVVRISSNISTKEQLNSYLQSVGGLTIYYPINKIVSPINVSILTNSNDNIHIDTSVPITCTHKVSLNTKSQIEELQEVVQKEKKSVWQKIKELTNVKINLSDNGYIKFPVLLGGLLIQWGVLKKDSSHGSIIQDVNYPITFNSIFFTSSTVSSVGNELGNASRYSSGHGARSNSVGVISASNLDGFVNSHHVVINWLAIGK